MVSVMTARRPVPSVGQVYALFVSHSRGGMKKAAVITAVALLAELLCPTGRTIAAPGDVPIADDDRDAGDVSATGLANQAQAVATVLAQARHRLATIADAVLGTPGPPDEPEAAALTALYAEAAETANRIAVLLGLDVLLLPSPC
jgi:hypothetical protein